MPLTSNMFALKLAWGVPEAGTDSTLPAAVSRRNVAIAAKPSHGAACKHSSLRNGWRSLAFSAQNKC